MSVDLTGPADGARVSERLVRAAVVVLAFATAGALCGVAWEAWWEAPTGVVYADEWFLDPAGPDVSFSGTALYVLLAVPVGFLLGAAAGMARGHEVVTLGSVLVGSLVAGWLMYVVGHTLGPPDPRVLAATEADYTRVDSDLVLAGPEEDASPYRSTAAVAFPLGATTGLALVHLSGFRQHRQR